jgi:hypothetical protein
MTQVARKPVTRKRSTRKSTAGWADTRDSRGIIRQAAADIRHGLEDTDRRGAARRKART